MVRQRNNGVACLSHSEGKRVALFEVVVIETDFEPLKPLEETIGEVPEP